MQAALTCSRGENRGPAVQAIVSIVLRTDPPRAIAFLAEHMEFFSGSRDLPLSAKDGSYRAIWDAITQLPAGSGRGALLARYLDDLWASRREESVRIWQELPANLRAELVTGSFTGSVAMLHGFRVPQEIPALEGMNEMRRRYVETTGDAAAAQHFVASRNGREWAQRDPAAAIAWAQQYLKGEVRLRAIPDLFYPAAAQNFDAALQALEVLPPGAVRARAIGNLAAAASAEHAAEVKTLLATLQGDDRRLADIARNTADSDEQMRRIRARGRRQQE
ncbi:MAG TPA: hypothetical protein VHM91_21245 [Verrucomicrobiales bacterium]|nr:hypothetical protein [Verrucomicrobiales bacterium]